MTITAFDIAQRFNGLSEVSGPMSNPQVLAMLHLDAQWPEGDEVPWCSAYVNYIAWLLRLPRSKSLRARSWLLCGTPVRLQDAIPGFDVVVFSRGGAGQPGPDVIEAPGHVGFFGGIEGESVLVLGGNQGDSVRLSSYPSNRVLGVRRLAT